MFLHCAAWAMPMGRIVETAVCIGDPEKLRVIGKIDERIDEDDLPLLARVLKGGFVRSQNFVTFKKDLSIITIYPDGHVGMTMIENKQEALSILRMIEEKIRYVRENRSRIKAKLTPMNVNVLEIYNLLPKLNCGKCGERTCMAFALKLTTGSRELSECKPLMTEGKYIRQRETLISLLTSMGIDVWL